MVGKAINCHQMREQKPRVLMHITKQADYTPFTAAALDTVTLGGEHARSHVKKIHQSRLDGSLFEGDLQRKPAGGVKSSSTS